MQRISVTIDDDLLEGIDALSARRGYTSRSEAVRDIVRERLAQENLSRGDEAPCVAVLSYVYEHETRELSKRLTAAQHHHHDISVSTLHVHLSNADCLEVTVMKGTTDEVRAFADAVTSQRGVRHGHLSVIPTVAKHGHE